MYASGDYATLAGLWLHPFHSTPRCRLTSSRSSSSEEGTEPAVIGTNAWGGELVRFSCGDDVAAYTVSISIDDGTDSASADFTIYLVLREGGWKVWGAY
jgi:hypothetical protein